MASYSWLERYALLSPTNLTIREQERTSNNPNDLRYRDIMPRKPTSSVKISEITMVDIRFPADRREWNAQAREIPEALGPARNFEMVPIGATKHLDEHFLQIAGEAGFEELTRRGIMTAVNEWPPRLADATELTLEIEAHEAWMTGAISVRDPKTGTIIAAPLGFNAATSYITAAVAWSGAVNAYDEFIVAARAARKKFGSLGGVRTSPAVIREILKDAPLAIGQARPSITQLTTRLAEDGFSNFALVEDERTYQTWVDGGKDVQAEQTFIPAGKLAFLPANGQIGNTHIAPVVRAYSFLTGGNRDLANGIVIFRNEKNDGKTLMMEAQQNALALPEEKYVYVVQTGVLS